MGKKRAPTAVKAEPVTPTMADIIWLDSDGIVHVRNSERGTLDRCPQQWWWSWRDGLRPKETPKPLWFGSAIHEALAEYYRPGLKRSSDYIDKFREYADMEAEYIRVQTGGIDETAWVEARELGETMLIGYVDKYKGDKTWDVIGTEQVFALRIPWLGRDDRHDEEYIRFVLNGQSFETDFFILDGTFDGVYRDKRDKRIRLMEHKTAASVSIAHLPMDNQAGTYWMVAQTVGRDQGWLGPKERLHEITYNFLRKALPDTRPKDKQGYSLNKPGKDDYVAALESMGHEFETTRTGSLKIPTIAVMEELCNERGLVVLGPRSKIQPPPLFERHEVRKTPAQRRTQLMRVQDEVTRMTMMVTGQLAVTKMSGRNTCPLCPFREMCELHESGSDWVDFRDALYRAEDPYAVHRKSA